jgi:nitrite reductase/ring-hydroxylating ferredoxin subunit
MSVDVMPIPAGMAADGTVDRPFEPICVLAEIPRGQMTRITRGDRDFLLVHTSAGLSLTDDRCPHMSAPLSLGTLDECVVACPLHRGTFDLRTGDVVQFPTTGGLDADGNVHAPWSPPGAPAKEEPTDLKARARALTRVRRMRFYPLRVDGDTIEAQLPA